MEIVNPDAIARFSARHSRARKPLGCWATIVDRADWLSFDDVKRTFRSADYVKGVVVFNIHGNDYRLIVDIDYGSQRLRILDVFTHSEYNRWKP